MLKEDGKSKLESTILSNEDNVTDFKTPAEMVLPSWQNTNDMLVLNYISKLYNNNAIPRSSIQNIIENTSQLVTNLLDNVNSQSQQKNFIPVLRNDSNYTEPFKNFDTEYKRFYNLEKLQFLIKSKSVSYWTNIGQCEYYKRCSNKNEKL